MPKSEPIVAIALLTQTNLQMLKGALPKVFPLPTDGRFDELLKALDTMERRQGPTRGPTDE